MAPLLAAALVTAGAGVVQGITGAIQKGKAASMAAKNTRPVYHIPQPIKDNVALAESRAQEGLTDAAKQTYKQNTEHGLTAAISAITNNGGSVNNIGDLYGNYQEGIGRMSIIDDEMRARNVQQLMGANQAEADSEDKEWQVNKYAPYADTAQAAAALSKQGSDNIWKGVNTIAGAGMNYAAGNLYDKEGNSVYGKNTVNMPTPAPVQRPQVQTIPVAKTIADKYPGLAGLNTPVPMATYNRIINSRMLQPGQIPSKDAATYGNTPPKPIDWSTYNFLAPVNTSR
jgi:hypothetical protein